MAIAKMTKRCPKCNLQLIPKKLVKINFQGQNGLMPMFTYRNGLPVGVFIAIFFLGYQFINYSVPLAFFIGCFGVLVWILMLFMPKAVYLCKKCNLLYVGSQLQPYDPASDDWEDA